MGILIDTSVLIRIERTWRDSQAIGIGVLPNDCAIAAITYSELCSGPLRAVTSAQRERARSFISDLISWLDVIPFDIRCAEVRAEIHEYLRQRGTLIGERDLQIAATALAGGHQLATLNLSEFERIPGLSLVTLPTPP